MRRPYVTLKLATSLDGKIALANGQSEWITGEKSRAAGRRLRATHDAIAIGSNTAVLDNPQLTTRIAGEPDPIRIVFDTQLRLRADSNLAKTAKQTPVWVITKDDAESGYLSELGVKILDVACDEHIRIDAALPVLRDQGVQTLLLEGGGQLAASFLVLDCVDKIEWFRAPIILGGDGRDGIGALGLESLSGKKVFTRVSTAELGDDLHEIYERAS